MSVKELDLEVKKVLKEAKVKNIIWEKIARYNGVSMYSKALFYVLDIKYYSNIFSRMAALLNLETGIPFKEAILEGKEIVNKYCKGKDFENSLDYSFWSCSLCLLRMRSGSPRKGPIKFFPEGSLTKRRANTDPTTRVLRLFSKTKKEIGFLFL